MPNQFYGGVFGYSAPATWTTEIAKTANYTILPSDNGTLFTTTGASGAVTFTLPAIKSGYVFGFLNVVDQNMAIASAAGDDIVTLNDASADSLTFSTSNEKIGAFVRIYSNHGGTKWLVEKLCSNTITVAT